MNPWYQLTKRIRVDIDMLMTMSTLIKNICQHKNLANSNSVGFNSQTEINIVKSILWGKIGMGEK